MGLDIFRDSTLGQIINKISGGSLLPYADQRPDYVVPHRYLLDDTWNTEPHPDYVKFLKQAMPNSSKEGDVVPVHKPSMATLVARHQEGEEVDISDSLQIPRIPEVGRVSPFGDLVPTHKPSFATLVDHGSDITIPLDDDDERPMEIGIHNIDLEAASIVTVPVQSEKGKVKFISSQASGIEIPDAPFLVTWDGPNDPDNPRNWSTVKKGFVAFSISILTFSVYIGSAIFTTSEIGIMKRFGVSQTKATLGLTLYVLAYGTGPMFLSPLQELPSLGRNPVYILGLIIFVIFNVPIVLAKNISTVLAFRFLTGFFGSPALATGGASMSDLFSSETLPYMLGLWGTGANFGPILGPVIGGFAAQAEDWRWPIFELMWISGFALIFLILFLPETQEANILLKRARRLRKLTGNPHLRSQSELDEAATSASEIAYDSLVRPFVLAVEPAVLFSNIFLGMVYAVFYLWFEGFPIVFNGIYHMNQGVGSLPFSSFIVTGLLAYFFYCWYQKNIMEPRIAKHGLKPEMLLEIGLMASVFIPISLFMFGWTARASVHWMAPIVAASLYLPGIFLTFQSILMYLAVSYPKYTGSVLASNDLFRSSMASVFPLFGTAFFKHLGLGPSCSLLAGISMVLMFLYYLIIRYGHRLRARSRYAS